MAARRSSAALFELVHQLGPRSLPRASTSRNVVSKSAVPTGVSGRSMSTSAASSKASAPARRSLHTTSSAPSARAAAAYSTSSSSSSSAPLQRRSARSGSAPTSALGSDLTPQQILAHFSKPPFSDGNVLGNNAELATRAMTHESYRYAKEGQNRRLAFLGRRTLNMLTTLFVHTQLQAQTPGSATYNYLTKLLETPSAIDAITTTHRLGDAIGKQLGLEKIMRWTPAVTEGELGPRETGLFKIRGVCVEALLGAIYHEKGAHEAAIFFESHVLPSLLNDGFPSPVPDSLKAAVRSTPTQS
ncbi:hypothetical protein BCV70DRAFT_70224 [Testicularia cyperi]|uniref:RNase III domain-containing protein n=1 Tax=Testicularia cyperi TaxID=1882483 RepID=A0A317XFU9_9BASI|nr:hypothetical protein BCV70DRAFT_70224 [Testicularia cyperi]